MNVSERLEDLSRRFAHARNLETPWVIITGAPCSGLSTVVSEIARRGQPVQEEVARQVFRAKLDRGLSMEQIRSQPLMNQCDILERQLSIMDRTDPQRTCFFDRGVVDSLAYLRLAGADESGCQALAGLFRPARVFFLERLPLKNDAIRVEDESAVAALHREIRNSWRKAGYEPIPVPCFCEQRDESVKRRTDFILDGVSEIVGARF